MTTIYLCGAINGCSDSECNDWRIAVTTALTGRYGFLNPMRRDFRGREDVSVQEIVEGDYADLAASDIVLVAADRPSWGTAMELHHAKIVLEKTVLAVCGGKSISPWLRYHCDRIFPSLESAIHYLKNQ